MPLKICLLFTLFFNVFSDIGQEKYNDTLFYKSGYDRIVHVMDYDFNRINFKYRSDKGEVIESSLPIRVLKGFSIYDDNDQLVDASHVPHSKFEEEVKKQKYPDTVTVAQHQFSINPFALALLSFNGQYRYRFGDKMQHGIVAKGLALFSNIQNDGYIGNYTFGLGYEFIPYYGGPASLGFDFCPTVGYDNFNESPYIQIPLSLKCDFRLTSSLNFAIEGGGGQIFHDGGSRPFIRGTIGLVFLFKPKVTFATAYFD